MAAEQIVAVFDTSAAADAAVADLEAFGILLSAIRRYEAGDTAAPQIGMARCPGKSIFEAFWSWLMRDAAPAATGQHEHRAEYEDHLTAGRRIIAVHAIDQLQAAEVTHVLEAHYPSAIRSQPETSETVDNNTTASGVLIRRYPEGMPKPVADPVFPSGERIEGKAADGSAGAGGAS